MKIELKIDDLKGEKIKQLLHEHLLGMAENTPAESIHALGLSDLKKPDVTFWSAWDDEDLLGCGALKELNSFHGEVKSMRTSTKYLRKGVAKYILIHIIKIAKERGYEKISLETGSQESFKPARHFYKSLGFSFCEPFEGYENDPNSVFMQLNLD